MRIKKWDSGSDYAGEDYSDYYVLVAQTQYASILETSNFRTIEAEMKRSFPEDFIIARFGHWACGYIELILIHQDNVECVNFANDILEQLDNYPIYDEDDYFRLENETVEYLWDDLGEDGRIELCERYNEKYDPDGYIPDACRDYLLSGLY